MGPFGRRAVRSASKMMQRRDRVETYRVTNGQEAARLFALTFSEFTTYTDFFQFTMPKPSLSAHKRVVSIRIDLLPRLIQKAEELHQNPNQLANLLVEGALDAMDAEGTYESPIVQTYRALKGKSLLTSKAVMAICSVVVPEIYKIDQDQQRILLDLINKHDGPLTATTLKGYHQLATQMNKERIEHEREIARLQRAQKSR